MLAVANRSQGQRLRRDRADVPGRAHARHCTQVIVAQQRRATARVITGHQTRRGHGAVWPLHILAGVVGAARYPDRRAFPGYKPGDAVVARRQVGDGVEAVINFGHRPDQVHRRQRLRRDRACRCGGIGDGVVAAHVGSGAVNNGVASLDAKGAEASTQHVLGGVFLGYRDGVPGHIASDRDGCRGGDEAVILLAVANRSQGQRALGDVRYCSPGTVAE